MKSFDSASLTNQDISSLLTAQTYVATRDFEMTVRMLLDNLSGTSGIRRLSVYIDGHEGASTNAINTTNTKAWLRLGTIPVKSGEQVEVKINGISSDTAVDIESEIFGLDALSSLDAARPTSPVPGSPIDDLHRCRARMANKVTETIDTRELSVKDDDGVTELYKLTPSESGGVISITPS